VAETNDPGAIAKATLPTAPESQPLSANLIRPELQAVASGVDAGGTAEQASWPSLWLPSRNTTEIVGMWVDLGLRALMAVLFLGMAWWWLCKVGTILQAQTTEKHLSDAVLIALVTTTTIHILGLLYFVANYLFPKSAGQKDASTPRSPTLPSQQK